MMQKHAARRSPAHKIMLAGRVAVGSGAIAVIVGIFTGLNILSASIFAAIFVAAFANFTVVISFSDIASSISFDAHFHPIIGYIVTFAILAFVAISSFSAFSFAFHPILASAITCISSGISALITGLVIIYSQRRK